MRGVAGDCGGLEGGEGGGKEWGVQEVARDKKNYIYYRIFQLLNVDSRIIFLCQIFQFSPFILFSDKLENMAVCVGGWVCVCVCAIEMIFFNLFIQKLWI